MSTKHLLSVLAVLVTFLGAASTGVDTGSCPSVPLVDGIDQSPSDPAFYGKCTSAIDPEQLHSNWCTAPGFSSWPDGPTAAATKCLKFARMTVYTGPIMGQSTDHYGACKTTLVGSDKHAMIAVSSKYLNHRQGGWTEDKGACGQCACVRLHGADEAYVGKSNINYDNVKKYQGLTFAAVVGDRCGECEDDHIDVLIDRPFSFSYYDPSMKDYDTKLPLNAKAPLVNRLPGLRGFSNPALLRGGSDSPAAVGVYTADWQWAPCTHTHADCALMFESVGYSGTTSSGLRSWTPTMTKGIDSNTLAYINDPSEDSCGPIINPDGTLIGAANVQKPASTSPTTTPSSTPTGQPTPATPTSQTSPATTSPQTSSPSTTPSTSPVVTAPANSPQASPATQQTATPSPSSSFGWLATDGTAATPTTSGSSSGTSLKGAAMLMSTSGSATQSAEPEGFKWLGLSGWQVGLVIAAIVVGGMVVLVAIAVGTALATRGKARVGDAYGVEAAVSAKGSKGLPVSGGASALPMHGVLVHTGLSRGGSGVTHRHSNAGNSAV